MEKYKWEDRRTCSLKILDLWDRHALKRQIKRQKAVLKKNKGHLECAIIPANHARICLLIIYNYVLLLSTALKIESPVSRNCQTQTKDFKSERFTQVLLFHCLLYFKCYAKVLDMLHIFILSTFRTIIWFKQNHC